jgi:hypothetical protein
MNNTHIYIFLIRLLITVVEVSIINSLADNNEDLPEWSEYLRRRGLVDYARARHERLQQHQLYLQQQKEKERQREDEVIESKSEPPPPAAAAAAAPTLVGVGGGGGILSNLVHWPSAGLCRGAPVDDSILGHVFCWSMVVSYVLLAVGLVIYMVRSIFYMKEMKQSRKETTAAQKTILELVPLMRNGRTPN